MPFTRLTGIGLGLVKMRRVLLETIFKQHGAFVTPSSPAASGTNPTKSVLDRATVT
ncbi:hypothetical protein ARGLB_077_00030 [Arthrobacter globiformis NBRC 12137]|uniref:Uncharacterized protein n=1 Tax=Arthrobacter globiformis (strain ATCC 8010 / DSM 20124 / JCM 1332 / NBRC 12137 / NCIMB 8907 / NRRL B-2979 / 168) TaxID=1077972 RepID=H0QPN6_ARTG1|nr:hypothetical protein ARGLB_077_00030 [Arthrobacter globiformis NBRC 12137]